MKILKLGLRKQIKLNWKSNSKHPCLSFFPKLGRKLRGLRVLISVTVLCHSYPLLSWNCTILVNDPSSLPHFSIFSFITIILICCIYFLFSHFQARSPQPSLYVCRHSQRSWEGGMAKGTEVRKLQRALRGSSILNQKEMGLGAQVRDHNVNVACSLGFYLAKQEAIEGLQPWSNMDCANILQSCVGERVDLFIKYCHSLVQDNKGLVQIRNSGIQEKEYLGIQGQNPRDTVIDSTSGARKRKESSWF